MANTSNLRITNITSNFKVNRKFDLDVVCRQPLISQSKITNVKGKPRRFKSAVESIITNGRIVTALIYESGSVVLVGGKSEEMVREALDSFLTTHDCKLEQPLCFSNFAMTFSVPFNLDLCRMYKNIMNNQYNELFCPIYEIEIFPSLLVTRRETNTKASIFHTGRVIITGCRCPTEGEEMYKILRPLLDQ